MRVLHTRTREQCQKWGSATWPGSVSPWAMHPSLCANLKGKPFHARLSSMSTCCKLCQLKSVSIIGQPFFTCASLVSERLTLSRSWWPFYTRVWKHFSMLEWASSPNGCCVLTFWKHLALNAKLTFPMVSSHTQDNSSLLWLGTHVGPQSYSVGKLSKSNKIQSKK